MLAIKVENEARIALETNRTVRCLRKRRYTLESRRPKDAKSWADKLADRACQAMMRDLGRDATASARQVLMIQLRRNHAYFCFDVFLQDGSDQPFNNELCRKTDQAVYRIVKTGRGEYSLERNKTAEKVFALHYLDIQRYDKGDLPYFQDWLNPSFYDDGILVEDPENFVTRDSDREEDLSNEIGDAKAKLVIKEA
ncbi:hypothetical protein F4680DRAFT_453404 [Xylaria scruposa]|nr:hypothetical protein F4680DRAFT_453404 [Xylaria scruposa]